MERGSGPQTNQLGSDEAFHLPRGEAADLASNSRYEQLFRQYVPRLLGFFRSLGVPEEERLDLTQETMTRVFQSGGSFENEGKFEAWLFEIARNVRRNNVRYRDAARRRGVEESLDARFEAMGDLSEVGFQPPVMPERDALQSLLKDEQRRLLWGEIQELPPKMRRCFELRIAQQRSYEEIACLLNIEVETVKAHLFQARKRLHKALGPVVESLHF